MLPAALLLDMDGTLIDTEPYWMEAEHALVARHGGTWSDEHALHLVGSSLLSAAEYIREHGPVDLEPIEIVEALLDDVCARVREHAPWRPGAEALLAQARELGVPCALVTMSWARLADIFVGSLPEGTFATVVTGDLVTHGKPHPEPYLTAAAALGALPAACVAVEDSPTGVASAVGAGVPTVAVPHAVPVPAQPGVAVAPTLAGLGLPTLTRLARREQG